MTDRRKVAVPSLLSQLVDQEPTGRRPAAFGHSSCAVRLWDVDNRSKGDKQTSEHSADCGLKGYGLPTLRGTFVTSGGIAFEEEDGGEAANRDGVGGQRESRRPGRDRG